MSDAGLEDDEADRVYDAWYQREQEAYPGLFGPATDGRKYGLLPGAFARFRAREVDPRWTNPGILVFEPNAGRRSTLYVSSGLSDPWDDLPKPEALRRHSGMGFEIVLEVASPSDWALDLASKVLAMAVYAGWTAPERRLDHGARVELGSPIDNERSALTNLVLARPVAFDPSICLESGTVDFLHLVGITTSEWQFAESNSSQDLLDVLLGASAYPVVDPHRRSLA